MVTFLTNSIRNTKCMVVLTRLMWQMDVILYCLSYLMKINEFSKYSRYSHYSLFVLWDIWVNFGLIFGVAREKLDFLVKHLSFSHGLKMVKMLLDKLFLKWTNISKFTRFVGMQNFFLCSSKCEKWDSKSITFDFIFVGRYHVYRLLYQ